MPGPLQRVPYALEDDHKLWVPASAFALIPVGSIAYSQAELNAAAALDAVVATSAGAVSAIFEADLANALEPVTASLGVINIKDIVLYYAVGVVNLTGVPVLTLSTVTFGAIGAAAAGPVDGSADVPVHLDPAVPANRRASPS